jgi:hypothetical protein
MPLKNRYIVDDSTDTEAKTPKLSKSKDICKKERDSSHIGLETT